MQVIRILSRPGRFALCLALLLCAACQGPRPVSDNPYQRPVTEPEIEAPQRSAPVQQLQNQALAAINEDQYELATEYLQRAIKIEPRDAWSWYYLADVHWRQGQVERCRSMLDRADAYAANDDQLVELAREMREQCR